MCRLQMPILAVPMIGGEGDNASVSGACVQPVETQKPKLSALWRNPDDVLHDILAEEMLGHRTVRQASDADSKEVIEERELTDLTSGRPFGWTPQIRGSLREFLHFTQLYNEIF